MNKNLEYARKLRNRYQNITTPDLEELTIAAALEVYVDYLTIFDGSKSCMDEIAKAVLEEREGGKME